MNKKELVDHLLEFYTSVSPYIEKDTIHQFAVDYVNDNINELSNKVYELSKNNNSLDDVMFFAIEELGEVQTATSHVRRKRSEADEFAREGIQAIIQIEQLAYHLGVLDRMWELYNPELRVLQHKIEKSKETKPKYYIKRWWNERGFHHGEPYALPEKFITKQEAKDYIKELEKNPQTRNGYFHEVHSL